MRGIGQMQETLGRCDEHPVPVQAHYAAGCGRFLVPGGGAVGAEKLRGFVGEAVLHWSV